MDDFNLIKINGYPFRRVSDICNTFLSIANGMADLGTNFFSIACSFSGKRQQNIQLASPLPKREILDPKNAVSDDRIH